MLDTSDLLFRRQFVLGPRFSNGLPTWNKVNIDGLGCLTAHPELNVSQTSCQDKSVTLVGYIIDPLHPNRNDQEVLNDMLDKLQKANDLFSILEPLAGRYVIILKLGNVRRILTDAAGFRQVYYVKNEGGSLWCGSQPSIFSYCQDLKTDPEFHDFRKTEYFRNNPEYWFPGSSTPYAYVKHLLPNTHLDLETGQVSRYWPNRPLVSMTLDNCVEESAPILKGIITAAANRYNLALAITAGLDSRLLFAASKEVQDKIFYYTQAKNTSSRNQPDIDVPRKLLARLGVKHNVITCPQEAAPWFIDIYKKNFPYAHLSKGSTIYSSFQQFNPENRVVINGNANEIARCYYHSYSLENLNATTLAKMEGIGGNAFAINQFKEWLESIESEKFNFDLRDLFYWEQRMGNWAAMVFSEADIAHETFSPYNCRALLQNLLSVDVKYRQWPNYSLYRKLIYRLWPEALQLPINPPQTFKGKVKKAIISNLCYAGIYPYIKDVKKKIFS